MLGGDTDVAWAEYELPATASCSGSFADEGVTFPLPDASLFLVRGGDRLTGVTRTHLGALPV